MTLRYVRIELPGGHARIVNDATYRKLCANMNEMARCLENAQFLDEVEGPTMRLANGSWWRKLFTENCRAAGGER